MTDVDLSLELQNIQNSKNGSNNINPVFFVISHLAEFQSLFAHSECTFLHKNVSGEMKNG